MQPPDSALSERTDPELIRDWVARRRQEDFTELVCRHLGLVRGVAIRQLGPDLADDTVQMVFAILARKAASLAEVRSLGAWLHRVTLLQCRGMVRRKVREQRNKQSAMEHALMADGRDPLSEALPYLDEALEKLPDSDRELIHLRFSEAMTFPEIARRLGRSEPALRQQSSRAVAKLADLLRRRGVVVPVGTLVAGLGTTLGGTGTASAASVVAAGALASSAGISGSTLAAIGFFTMSTKQSIFAAAVFAVVLVSGPLAWRAREIQQVADAISKGEGMDPGKADERARGGSGASRAGPARTKSVQDRTRKLLTAGQKEARLKIAANLFQKEFMDGVSDWFRQTAELEARRLSLELELSPELAKELEQFLVMQGEAQTKFPPAPEPGMTKVQRGRKALREWFAGRLSPEQFGMLERFEQKSYAAAAERVADESVSGFTGAVDLDPAKKALLHDAAYARVMETLRKGEYQRGMGFAVNIAVQPYLVEEESDDLVALVLDPVQLDLWRATLGRDRIFSRELPERLFEQGAILCSGPAGDELIGQMKGE